VAVFATGYVLQATYFDKSDATNTFDQPINFRTEGIRFENHKAPRRAPAKEKQSPWRP
jgi:hypothetical protein